MVCEIRNLGWRKILVTSVLLATAGLGGISEITSVRADEGWKCQDSAVPNCSTNGCRRSSGQPDSFWVCNYVGEACPPLEACVGGSEEND